jgi:hypothetical protein
VAVDVQQGVSVIGGGDGVAVPDLLKQGFSHGLPQKRRGRPYGSRGGLVNDAPHSDFPDGPGNAPPTRREARRWQTGWTWRGGRVDYSTYLLFVINNCTFMKLFDSYNTFLYVNRKDLTDTAPIGYDNMR